MNNTKESLAGTQGPSGLIPGMAGMRYRKKSTHSFIHDQEPTVADAMLERLLHNSHRIATVKGGSMRKATKSTTITDWILTATRDGITGRPQDLRTVAHPLLLPPRGQRMKTGFARWM